MSFSLYYCIFYIIDEFCSVDSHKNRYKYVATRCIVRRKCTKFDFGRGSTPGLTGELNQLIALSQTLSWWKGGLTALSAEILYPPLNVCNPQFIVLVYSANADCGILVIM